MSYRTHNILSNKYSRHLLSKNEKIIKLIQIIRKHEFLRIRLHKLKKIYIYIYHNDE